MFSSTKTGNAWEKIFKALNLSASLKKHGFVFVTADQIKKYGQREPRLIGNPLTREERRTELLRNITILPVSSGVYGLYRFDGYHDLEKLPKVQSYKTNELSGLQTLRLSEISTESQALDTAFTASLLKHFTGEKDLSLTIRGKQGLTPFRFGVRMENGREKSIRVGNVGIEVDAGYEGRRVYLFEAKIGNRNNFLVRQLYYPFRAWSQKMRKEIVPIFFTFSNGEFGFWRYKFVRKNRYDSLRFIEGGKFVINERAQETFSYQSILSQARHVLNPKAIPFPQADDFEKVINVIDAVGRGICEKQEISRYYEYDERQADYYGNAARYLGLLEKKDNSFTLSKLGRSFIANSRSNRIKTLAIQMLSRKPFRESFRLFLMERKVDVLPLKQIIMKSASVNEITATRRAQTVTRWISWLKEYVH